jgi:hypothetical protein
MNFHHFLYEQALLRKQAGGTGQSTNSGKNPKNQLSSEQQDVWFAAVDYYKNTLIKRDLLLDIKSQNSISSSGNIESFIILRPEHSSEYATGEWLP